MVPTAASGAGSPEACRARPAAFRNPVQRAASGPAVAWLAGGPRGREGASPCGPRLRRAWAPAPQYAAWGAQTLQGMRKKSALRGSACRPAPVGAARPVAPLGGFCARVPIRRHPLPPRLLVVVVGGSGFPPPAAGPAPRDCRGREGFARSRPGAPLGLLPARFFSPAPCNLAGGPAFSHSPWLALVVPALCMAARRGRAAPPLRAARYTEGAEDGGTNDRRRDRAGKPYRPPGGWFRALPASLLTLKALPHIGQYRQYSRTG